MRAATNNPVQFWDEQARFRRRLPLLFLPLFFAHSVFTSIVATGMIFCLQFFHAFIGVFEPSEGRFDLIRQWNRFMHQVFQLPEWEWVILLALILAAGQLAFSLSRAVAIVSSDRWKVPEPLDPLQRRAMNIVEEMAIAHGIIQPFVRISRDFGINALAIAGSQDTVVVISEGAISRLSRDALQALIANAVAQIELGDSQICTGIVAISRAAAILRVKNLDEKFLSWGTLPLGMILMIPAVILSLFSLFTSFAISFMIPMITRERKFLADAGAIQLTRNPAALVEAFESHRRVQKITMDIPAAIYGILAVFFPGYRFNVAGYFGDFFTSHPSLDERLDRIESMAPDAVSEARKSIREKRLPIREESSDQKDAGGKAISRFMVEHSGSWSGPYTLSQLAILSWIGDAASVTSVDDPGRNLMKNSPLLRRIGKEKKAAVLFPFACPHCGSEVLKEIYEGVKIGRCGRCAGTVLNAEKLKRIFLRESREISWALNEDFVATIRKDDDRPSMECPTCHDFMSRNIYGSFIRVSVDSCPKCGMIYLDFGELEVLRMSASTPRNEP